MATRTRSRSTGGDGSGLGQAGMLAAAAMAGAAVGLAANYGRKLAVQGLAGTAGDWADALAAEHRAVLALFDKLEATGDEQTWIRAHTLTRIRNALGRHALEEENVVYPALREANDRADAEGLETEHGEVKEFLYRLQHMELDAPNWLETIREFRAAVEAHAKMEEEQVFPRLRSEIDDALDERITKEVNKAGFMMA